MNLFLGLFLIILGTACLSSLIEQSIPASKRWLQYLNQYQSWLGLFSLTLVFLQLIGWILALLRLGIPLLHIVISLASFALIFVFSVFLGFELIGEPIRRIYEPLYTTLSNMRFRLLPYRIWLGAAAMATGLLTFIA